MGAVTANPLAPGVRNQWGLTGIGSEKGRPQVLYFCRIDPVQPLRPGYISGARPRLGVRPGHGIADRNAAILNDPRGDAALAVNRRWIGTPYRHPKGTPLSGEFGR